MQPQGVRLVIATALLAGLPVFPPWLPDVHAAPNIRLTSDPAASVKPRVAFDPQGNVIVVWEDSRYGNPEILWQRFDPLGAEITAPIRLTTSSGPTYPTNPDVSCDLGGVSHVTWQVGSDSQRERGQMFVCRVALDGSKPLPNTPIYGPDAVGPRVAATPGGQTYVTWFQYDNFGQYVRLKRLGASGAAECSLAYRLTVPAIQKRPVVAVNSSDGASIYWVDMTTMFSYTLTRGAATWPCAPTGGSGVQGTSNEFLFPSVDIAGSMEVAAYQTGGDIYLRLHPSAACRISSGTHTASLPAVGADGSYGYVAWQDTRDGNSEIYFARSSGCTSMTGDIRLTQDGAASTNPDIAVEKSGNRHWVVVWQESRDGNTEIYMTSGDQPFVSAPATVVAAEGLVTQFQVTASDPDGEAINSLTASPLPPAATMLVTPDQSSATVTWAPTPQDYGDYPVTFTAQNSLVGTATTVIAARPKYEVSSASVNSSVFRIGDNANLILTIRNNTPAAVDLTLDIDELQGPIPSAVVYPLSSSVRSLVPFGSLELQIPFTVQGVLTGIMLPYHVRIRLRDPDGLVYVEDLNVEFGTTDLSNEAIQAIADEFDVCTAASPPGDTFLSYYPCMRDFIGGFGVTGTILGFAAARQGIIDASCRAAQFASAGMTCERNVALILVGTSVFSMGLSAATLAGVVSPTMAAAGLVLRQAKCALNFISQGQIESWICSHLPVGASGASWLAEEIGQGDKARDLLDSAASESDSLGIPFVAHIAIEGPVAPRLELGAGWVSPESTTVDDAVGWTLATDTLSWFSVGPRVSALAMGFDTTAATIHAIDPLAVTLRATRSGNVFAGATIRLPESRATTRVNHGPVAVDSGAVLCAWFSRGNPLLIDFDGNGVWDEVRYPDGTVLTSTEQGPIDDPGPGWLVAYPNPTRGGAALRFGLGARARASLRIFDARGRLVRSLQDHIMDPGPREIRWDGADASGRPVATGVYYVELKWGEVVRHRKIVVLK